MNLKKFLRLFQRKTHEKVVILDHKDHVLWSTFWGMMRSAQNSASKGRIKESRQSLNAARACLQKLNSTDELNKSFDEIIRNTNKILDEYESYLNKN